MKLTGVMADYLRMEHKMSHEIETIKGNLSTLQSAMGTNLTACRFIFRHIIDTIDKKYPDDDFTASLKESIKSDLDKLTHIESEKYRKAINDLLKSPVQQMFQPKEDPFIK